GAAVLAGGAGRPAELGAGSELGAAAVEAPRAAMWAPGAEEAPVALPPPRTRGPSGTGTSRIEQAGPTRPPGLARLVRDPTAGSLHRALRAQRPPPGPRNRLPVTSTS